MDFKIKTLVFFDLETTGLPQWDKRTKITELSMIAIPTFNFLNEDFNNLRVQHKLNLIFNPMKMIPYKVIEITGLSNEMLEHENKFNSSSMKLINQFFEHLIPPIVLIAHNGNGFDFRILKKYYEEFENPIGDFIKCCDSIPVFRRIFDMDQYKFFTEMKTSTPPPVSPPVSEKTDDSSLDDEFFNLVEQELQEIERIERQRINGDNKKEDEEDLFLQIQRQNEKTPEQRPIPQNHLADNKKRRISPTSTPIENSNDDSGSRSKTRRELFPSPTSSTQQSQSQSQSQSPSQRPVRSRQSLKLVEIYKHFFGCYPPQAHHAEADVDTLIKCVDACKRDFVEIVERTFSNFSDIKKF